MCLRAAIRPDSRRFIFTANKWRRTNVVLKWRGVQTESLIWYLQLTIIHINIDMFVEHYWRVKNREFIPLKYVLCTVLYYCEPTVLYYCTPTVLYYCTPTLLYYFTPTVLYYCTPTLLYYFTPAELLFQQSFQTFRTSYHIYVVWSNKGENFQGKLCSQEHIRTLESKSAQLETPVILYVFLLVIVGIKSLSLPLWKFLMLSKSAPIKSCPVLLCTVHHNIIYLQRLTLTSGTWSLSVRDMTNVLSNYLLIFNIK